MSKEENTLRYIDETDRCYGLTGMVMSMVVLDSSELLAAIDLDSPADEMVKFTQHYYFSGNPRFSARIAWNELVEHYQLTMSMVIANVLCRSYVHKHSEISPEQLKQMHGYITDEGQATCQLETDEINNLFNRQFSYMQRLFRHSGVQGIVNDFASKLLKSRTMTAAEVLEGFSSLRML